MNESRLFTNDGAWIGGHYSLAIIYRNARQGVPDAAIRALWDDAAIDGVYLDSTVEPGQQQRFNHQEMKLTDDARWLGVLSTGDGMRIPIGMYFFLLDGEREAWLELNIPMGGLVHADRRAAGFPFGGTNSQAWRLPLDAQLARIAMRVFDASPFELGLIGMEPLDRDFDEFVRVGQAPKDRWVGWLVPDGGKLAWLPPTIYDAPFA